MWKAERTLIYGMLIYLILVVIAIMFESMTMFYVVHIAVLFLISITFIIDDLRNW